MVLFFIGLTVGGTFGYIIASVMITNHNSELNAERGLLYEKH